ncbi:MAG TPA: hypothetical protein VNW06_13055 [Cytophagaceae bacterium]|nr:hypothetical protein [Cytophagaceae bacterium]
MFISFPLALRGQGTGDSPFSQFGVGDINNSGNMRNMGMGNAGVSSRSHHFVNFLNPALLPNLRSPKKSRPNHTYKMWEYYRNLKLDSTVKIDFAVNFQDKSIQAPRGANENTSGMNVAYLTFALPISKTWATAFGIVPYSIVNYNLTYNNVLPNNPTVTNTVQNSTKGGIYKVFVSNGLGITQNLSVGLETAFLYGNVNDELFSLLPDLTTSSFGFKRQTVYRSFELKPGLQFRKEIVKAYHDTIYEEDSMGNKTIPVRTRKTKSSGVFYNIGLTYDFYSALNITRNLDLYVVNNVNTITLDSLVQTNKYKAKLPSTLRFGFSLDAPLKWTIAADVFYSPWSNYKTGFSTDTLGNSYGLNIGGEFCPNSTKQKSKTFRAGFSYVKTPVIYRGYQLDDMSISFGASIPLGRNRRPNAEQYMMPVRPKLNFALVVGQRGNVNTFGIKEQYVKLYASFLINQKWFNKSKIY